MFFFYLEKVHNELESDYSLTNTSSNRTYLLILHDSLNLKYSSSQTHVLLSPSHIAFSVRHWSSQEQASSRSTPEVENMKT